MLSFIWLTLYLNPLHVFTLYRPLFCFTSYYKFTTFLHHNSIFQYLFTTTLHDIYKHISFLQYLRRFYHSFYLSGLFRMNENILLFPFKTTFLERNPFHSPYSLYYFIHLHTSYHVYFIYTHIDTYIHIHFFHIHIVERFYLFFIVFYQQV